MMGLARTFLVLCTALSAFVASSLHGKVLCIGDGGHAAVEPPHEDAPCPASHESHGHEDEEHAPGDRDCNDVSADFLAARDGSATASDAPHFDPALLPPPPQADALTTRHPPPSRFGLGTHPPFHGDLACLRTILLLI